MNYSWLNFSTFNRRLCTVPTLAVVHDVSGPAADTTPLTSAAPAVRLLVVAGAWLVNAVHIHVHEYLYAMAHLCQSLLRMPLSLTLPQSRTVCQRFDKSCRSC